MNLVKQIRQTFYSFAVLAINAASATAESGDWTIRNVGGLVSISTSAVEGDYCRQEQLKLLDLEERYNFKAKFEVMESMEFPGTPEFHQVNGQKT